MGASRKSKDFPKIITTAVATMVAVLTGIVATVEDLDKICKYFGGCISNDLTVMVNFYEQPHVSNDGVSVSSQYQVNYSSIEKDGYLDVSYSTDYFESEAKPVGVFGTGPFFNLPKVGIDIKFANNTDKSIIISKVNLEVISSKINNQPIMILPSDVSAVGNIRFKNEGWGVPKELQVLARVKNGKSAEYIELPYTAYEDSYVFDISPILEEYGIKINEVIKSVNHERLTDFENIKENQIVRDAHFLCIQNFHPDSLDKYLNRHIFVFDGPFMDFPFNCTVTIEGTLQFSWGDGGNKNHEIYFSTDVFVSPAEGLGDLGLEPTGSYEIDLKPEGYSYMISKPIFHTLKAGEFDRIVLFLGTSQSSNHDFRVTVEYNNNEMASSSRIKLNYFMPKENAYILESFK